jgi:hypothetical protein
VQHIFVVPELDFVVVLTSGLNDNVALAWVAHILNRYALAAVTELHSQFLLAILPPRAVNGDPCTLLAWQPSK